MNDSDAIRLKSAQAGPLSLPGAREAGARPNDILQQISDAVIVTDTEGYVTGWNRGAEMLTAYRAEDILGQHVTLLFPIEPETICRLKAVGHCAIELAVRRKFGEIVHVHLSLSLLRGPNGMASGMAGFALDITERKQAEEVLRRSEKRFQLATEAVDAMVFEYDLATDEVFRSQGLFPILGFRPEEAPAAADWWIGRIHPDDLLRVRARAEAMKHSETFLDVDYRVLHRSGEYVHVWDRALIVRDEQGQAVSVVGCTVNINERKQAEEQLRESEERHRLLSELTSDYTYTCRVNADGTINIESATEGFTRVTGFTVAEVEARGGWATLIHPLDLPAATKRSKLLFAGQRDDNELRVVTKSGETRWLRYSNHPIWNAARRRVVRVLGVGQDITERKNAELKLQDYAQRLQALSRRLLHVQESERRHLARELHDEVAQALTALSLNLEMGMKQEGEPLRRSLEEAQALVKDLTARVRDLSLRLRPTMLDDLGLLPALVWLFKRYTGQTRIQVDFQHSGMGRRFRPEIETAAYRIVQEALTNVARYAGTHWVTVRLWLDRDALCLQVKDRGVGFDPEAVQGAGASSGLSGMHERAELLGGRLLVESVQGEGTCLTAELPVLPEEENQAHGTDPGAGG